MMKTLPILIGLFILLTTSQIFAQSIGISETAAVPDASAMLDIQSADKGLLIPRMDETSRMNIINPATGLLVFDTTNLAFYYYDGSGWLNLSSHWDKNGNDIFNTNSGKVGIGTNTPTAKLDVRGAIVFNEDGLGAPNSFRVESDANPNMLMVNAVTDQVGIGTSNLTASLTVNSSATFNSGKTNSEFIIYPQNIGVPLF